MEDRGNQSTETKSDRSTAISRGGSGGSDVGRGDTSERGVGKRVATHAKSYLADELHNRRAKSSNDLGMLAKALRLTSEQLEGNIASPYVERIAGRIERASELISRGDFKDIARATEDLARRQPLLFYTGAFIAGIGGARFLKATAQVAGQATEKVTEQVASRRQQKD